MSILEQLVNVITFRSDMQSYNQAQGLFDNIANKAQSVAGFMTKTFTLPFTALATAAVKFSSDFRENENLFKQVMGNLTDTANDWAQKFSGNLNRIADGTKLALTQLQAMFVGFGDTASNAFEKAKLMVTAAEDIGSAFNRSAKEMRGRFISAMSGSAEVLDRFGINIKESGLRLEAQTQGIQKSIHKMSELEKVNLRVAIIMKTITRQGVLGDAIRTVNEFANSVRSVVELMRGFLIRIGNELLPTMTILSNGLVKLLKFLNTMDFPLARIIALGGGVLAIIGPLIGGITALFTVFAPLLPLIIGISGALIVLVPLLTGFVDDMLHFFKGNDSMLQRWLGSWEELKPKIHKAFNDTVDTVKTIWKNRLKPIFTDIIDFFKAFFVKDMDKASDLVFSIARKIWNIIKRVWEIIKKIYDENKDEVSKKIKDFLLEIVDSLILFAESFIPKFFDKVWVYVKKGLKKIGENLKNEVSEYGNNIAEAFNIEKTGKKILENLKKTDAFNLKKTGKQILEGITGIFKPTDSEISRLQEQINQQRLERFTNKTLNVNVNTEVTGTENVDMKETVKNASSLGVQEALREALNVGSDFPILEGNIPR